MTSEPKQNARLLLFGKDKFHSLISYFHLLSLLAIKTFKGKEV